MLKIRKRSGIRNKKNGNNNNGNHDVRMLSKEIDMIRWIGTFGLIAIIIITKAYESGTIGMITGLLTGALIPKHDAINRAKNI